MKNKTSTFSTWTLMAFLGQGLRREPTPDWHTLWRREVPTAEAMMDKATPTADAMMSKETPTADAMMDKETPTADAMMSKEAPAWYSASLTNASTGQAFTINQISKARLCW
ncbi:hypothetical protein [Candidatus Villigracilis saccharophilus]|uniref:hypothetical protein n=1 Tax=Candidatus Villigracilis saccharophilus TaxID=3140684 RepID=UPI003134DA5A|nr:hypothetical protein [Anaerolineales bacterium]